MDVQDPLLHPLSPEVVHLIQGILAHCAGNDARAAQCLLAGAGGPEYRWPSSASTLRAIDAHASRLMHARTLIGRVRARMQADTAPN